MPSHWVFPSLSDPAGIRTPNLRIRSAVLYPVKLRSHFEGANIANKSALLHVNGFENKLMLNSAFIDFTELDLLKTGIIAHVDGELAPEGNLSA